MAATVEEVWRWLASVPDPEIPAVSVVDLGIVRDVRWSSGDEDATLNVTITPTYCGCPATAVIQRDIERALREHGVGRLTLDVRLSPSWTTDWLSAEAKEKLRAYGIAPPQEAASASRVAALGAWPGGKPQVACTRCASEDVALTSRFGSTPCKALYRCNACREPFDYFKCH